MKKKSSAKGRSPKPAAKRSAKPGESRLLAPGFLQGCTGEPETLLAMERLLRRAEGFTLAFARVNMPAQRAALVQEIRRRLEPQGFIIFEVDLREPVHDLLWELETRLHRFYSLKSQNEKPQLAVAEAGPRHAIFVYGLENSISSSAIYHPLLAVMNYKRENFRSQIPAPLILWTPEYVLQAIIEGAPDFWAWRSGVFEFAAPQADVEKMWQTVKPERGQVKLDRLSAEEKQHRIQLFSNLLAEYESQSDAELPDLIAVRTDLLNRLGRLYFILGEFSKALEHLEKRLTIQRQIGDRAGEGTTLNNISQIYHARGDYGKALEYLEKNLAIRREIGDRAGEGTALNDISRVFKTRGDYRKALEYLEKSLAIQREIGDRTREGETLNKIGRVLQECGDYRKALEYLEKSLVISREIDDRTSESTTLNDLGRFYANRGDNKIALEFLEKSRAVQRDINDRAGEGKTLNNLATTAYASGEYGKALEYFEKSLSIFHEIGNRMGEGTTLNNISQVFKARGDYEKALEYLEKSLAIRRKIGDRTGEGTALNNISQVFKARGDYEQALEYLEKSLAIRRESGDRAGEGTSLYNIARIQLKIKQFKEAISSFTLALKLASESNDSQLIFSTSRYLGSVLCQTGQKEQGRLLLQQALDVGQQIDHPNLEKVEALLQKYS